MQNPLVSIIVPVYNAAKYVERCFNSVISLKYENIECIFIDDCSTDNSSEILEGITKEHKKVFVIKHSQNKGQAAARNSGIKKACGDYIFFMDSDDEITPNSISDLVETLQKYPKSEIIQGAIKQTPFVRHKGDWIDISNMKNLLNYENPRQIKKMFLSFPRVPVSVWAKLILREFIVRNELFFREGIMNEDDEWSYRAAKYINCISFTKEICYIYYTTNPNSIMNTPDLTKRINSWLIIFEDMLKNLDDDVKIMRIRFIDSLMQTIFCDIKSDKKYAVFMEKYKEIYEKLRLIKRKYPLAYIPNKLYVKMKVKQILGNKLSRFLRNMRV